MEVELIASHNHAEQINASKIDFSTTLDHSLKEIVKSEGFINYKIDKRLIPSDGSNYLGTLQEINVKGTTKDGDKQISIFAKQIINLESYQVISLPDLYSLEIFAYKELSKIFSELQENANVPKKERFKMVKVYDESNTETILMENLTKSGFTTFNRMDVITLKFAEKSVKELAKLHALSLVLREKRPEYFENKIKYIKYPINFTCEDWIEMSKKSRDEVINLVDEELRDKVEKAYNDLPIKYAQYQNDENIKVCLCHGDYKISNIMVKINEGEIQDVMPVDYQLMHFGCPLFDFIYFIFGGTDQDFRKAHLCNLKELYYETLSNFLKYFDLHADMVYSKKEFDQVYKERLDYGLMIALTFMPYFFASEENVPDLSKDPSQMSLQLDDRFRARFRGVIEDFIEWGYI